MEIEIIFMDAAAPKRIVCDNVYTKGHMLYIRKGECIYAIELDRKLELDLKHGDRPYQSILR